MSSNRGLERAAREAAVTLLTSWHLERMRSMPAAMLGLRRLERRVRGQPGCLEARRWLSRRSLMLASTWRSPEELEAWLASEPFRAFDARLRRMPGAQARVQRLGPAQSS